MSATGQPNEVRVTKARYTATIRVHFAKTVVTANERGYFDNPPAETSGTMVNIELEATSLPKLQDKIYAHVGLVDEE